MTSTFPCSPCSGYLHSICNGIQLNSAIPQFTFFHCYPVTFCLAPILRAAAAARAAADNNSKLNVQQHAMSLAISIPTTTSTPGDACSTSVSTATYTVPSISHNRPRKVPPLPHLPPEAGWHPPTRLTTKPLSNGVS